MKCSGLENFRPTVAQRPPRPAYNPYEGREVTGKVETVLSRGKVIIENDKFVGRPDQVSFSRESREAEGNNIYIVIIPKCHTEEPRDEESVSSIHQKPLEQFLASFGMTS